MFDDVTVPDIPSALNTNLLKQDGIYVGEGVIKQVLSNKRYKVTVNDNRIFDCRAVFNIGENILPKGIPVHCIVHNADGYILGRVRPINDDEKDDGTTEPEQSPVIGSEGDATLRPHTPNEKNLVAEVTVTRGGVVKLKASGATNITMYPVGERIIQKCQTLLAFSDAYRIQSGRVAATAGVQLKAQTKEAYKDMVGPVRTEVRITNGDIDGSAVHLFSVDTLATAAGVNTGLINFQWEVTKTGTWQVLFGTSIKFGSISDQPVVMGGHLSALLNALSTEMISLRSAVSTLALAISAAGAAATAAASGPPLPPTNQAAILALGGALTAAGTPVSVLALKSLGAVTANQVTYLTPLGALKELILSDFMSTQKIPPLTGPIVEPVA